MTYSKHPEWVSCPRCGSEEVSVWTDYDGQVGFQCVECGAEKEPSFGEHVEEEGDDGE